MQFISSLAKIKNYFFSFYKFLSVAENWIVIFLMEKMCSDYEIESNLWKEGIEILGAWKCFWTLKWKETNFSIVKTETYTPRMDQSE